jgi:mannitol 2-dehydrogenase
MSPMTALNASTLTSLDPKIRVPGYDRKALRPGIVHFGVGNFFRVFEAVYVDDCLHKPGNEAWGIVGVGLLDGAASREKAASFKAQDGLYSVTEFDGKGRPTYRVIGSLIDYLHAPADPEAVLARLTDPQCRIVTMTITEGGYNIDEASGRFMLDTPDVAADLAGGPPRSVFGFIVEALARRRKAGVPAFTVASCDNLRGSGDTIKKAILGFAAARDPDLAAWIEANVGFPNSMVDRLAPQVSAEGRDVLNKGTGLDDKVPVLTEEFTQWVVEDDFRSGRPPLEVEGVEFKPNVAEFLALKGRLINAPHVFLSYPGLLVGHRIVGEALADPLLVRLVEAFLAEDSVPNTKGPPGIDVKAFAAKFVPRFVNPAIPDQLLRVAGDGAAKLPTFHAGIVRAQLDKGADLRRVAFLMAAYGRYLAFATDDSAVDDKGGRFKPFEPGLSEDDWAKVRGGPRGVLAIQALAPLDLTGNPAFMALFDRYAGMLAKGETRAAIADVLA